MFGIGVTSYQYQGNLHILGQVTGVASLQYQGNLHTLQLLQFYDFLFLFVLCFVHTLVNYNYLLFLLFVQG